MTSIPHYSFNRKEPKQHGEGGWVVGRVPASEDKIVIVDDVITDGTTKIETIQRLRDSFDAEILGLLVALDRKEKRPDGGSASRELERQPGLRCVRSSRFTTSWTTWRQAAPRTERTTTGSALKNICGSMESLKGSETGGLAGRPCCVLSLRASISGSRLQDLNGFFRRVYDVGSRRDHEFKQPFVQLGVTATSSNRWERTVSPDR